MSRRFIIVLLMLQCVLLLAAHDVVLKVNGDEIEAKVTEVGLTEIKYKRASNLSGPTYTIPITEVFMITYNNGEKDVFGRQRNTPVVADDATGQAEGDGTDEDGGQQRKSEWTIFRTSNKSVIYTVKAVIPDEDWDF